MMSANRVLAPYESSLKALWIMFSALFFSSLVS